MPGGLLLALALVAGNIAAAPDLTLELRVFNGAEDVTRQSRVAVHRAGERGSPLVQIAAGHAPLVAEVPPGIYDVQAILERDGRVVHIRWAQRLVVMAYPDEAGRHLEVVNFQSGFGALEVRRRDRQRAQTLLYPAGDHTKAIAEPFEGAGYVVFVIQAGSYDLLTRGPSGDLWHAALEVPVDRTRFWIEP